MAYHTWNSTHGLEAFARVSFETLEAAQQYTTPAGGPNRITADDGREWVLAAYPDRQPQWFACRPEPHPARPVIL